MVLHQCTKCKSAFTTVVELHQHLEKVHELTLTWKCEFCHYESQKIANLKKHYIRFERRDAKDTRSCTLSEASGSFTRRIERLKRKRGCPEPKDSHQPTLSTTPVTQPSLSSLPKIPKLKLSTKDVKLDDEISLYTEESLDDPEPTTSQLDVPQEPELNCPIASKAPSPKMDSQPIVTTSPSPTPDVRIVVPVEEPQDDDDTVTITVGRGRNKYGTLKLKSITVITERFYNVYGIERRGEVQTKTAYFDNE